MKTLEEKRAYNREWYRKNREKCCEARNKARKKCERWYRKALSYWDEIIPKEIFCQVCGKKIFFNNRNTRSAVHFDHRNGGNETIKGSPVNWLRNHKPTEENIKIWEENDFGTLCENCNRCLPTKRRKEWLMRAWIYANGFNGTINPMEM